MEYSAPWDVFWCWVLDGICVFQTETYYFFILHFRFLNISADFDIIFPSDSSSKLFNNYFTISVLPSHSIPLLPILYLIKLTKIAVSTQLM